MKSYYLLTIVLFLAAVVRGIEKGKKSGYIILGLLGVAAALFTCGIFWELSHTLATQSMGKPEILGSRLGSLLAIALSTSIALGIYSSLFMMIKFNKKDLVPEICCIAFSVIIVVGSIQLVGTLSGLDEKYSFPSVSIKSAKQAVTVK